MPATNHTAFRLTLLPLYTVLLTALAACGGANDGADSSSAASPATTGLNTAAGGRATALATSVAPAPDQSTGKGGTPGNGSTVGAERALGSAASLFVQGVPELATAAAALAVDSTGRMFYVDSRIGDDTNNGRAATAGGTGVGPWRTLARLMQGGIAAADTVVLACNSTWTETLRLPTSGSPAHPITVTAPAGCTTAPLIDGGTSIAAAAWVQHSGNIYKTPLTQAPQQLVSSGTGFFTEAHHPNRGYLPSDPTSAYAALPGDGNIVTVGLRTGSNWLYTGPDLALPAGASIAAGARIRLRTGAWLIDDATIAGVTGGNQLTLNAPTTYPAKAGRGYMLLGQLWMLDSAGEWFYDAATQMLYAWMPTSTAPGTTVTVGMLATGIDLNGRSNVVIDGLAVRRVGAGVLMRGSQYVRVRNSVFEDVANMGADAAFSSGALFESNTFTRIGIDAISGQDNDSGVSYYMTVRNNLLRDIGVIVRGDDVMSLPRNSNAAIRSGVSSMVTGNTIINTGYTAIRPGSNSLVQDNFIFGACTVLDDGAAIHVWSAQGVNVFHNTVLHSRGSAAGKPAAVAFTQAQGIYFDESTSNSAISDNTVVDADNGIQIHVSANNQLRSNVLYGNRLSQLWMQETNEHNNLIGNLVGNSVVNNQIAAVYPGTPGLLFQSYFASTANFGTFESNQYYERASSTVTAVSTATTTSAYTLAQWRLSSGVGSTLPVDANGSGVGGGGFASYNVTGANIVPNTALTYDAVGWTTWNLSTPYGQLVRENCAPGKCVRYAVGGSAGLVSSPNFSVVAGQWYRLTVDLATEQANQFVQIIVRRGGGTGETAYEMLTDRGLGVAAGQAWGRYSMIFQATKSDFTGNEASGDKGARVDFADIQGGRSLSIANLELVTITPGAFAQVSGTLVNAGGSTLLAACPYTATQPALCSKLVKLTDGQPVVWPLSMAARSSVIFYGQEPTLMDSDGDGIPDAQDYCPGTTAGAAVNAVGCSYAQH